MTEVVGISTEGFAAMWFSIGLLAGFFVGPFVMWLAKSILRMIDG